MEALGVEQRSACSDKRRTCFSSCRLADLSLVMVLFNDAASHSKLRTQNANAESSAATRHVAVSSFGTFPESCFPA